MLLPFVSCQDWHGNILPIIYLFIRCISTPWIFSCSGLLSVSDVDNRLRDLLRYWGFLSFFMSPMIFWRGLRSGQGIFPIDPARAGFSILSYLFGDLCSCCRGFKWITASLVALISEGSLFSLSFLLWKGLKNSRRECFAPSQGVFSLPSFFINPWQRRSKQAFGCPKVSQFSWGFSKVLESTSPQLLAMPREVLTFPSVLLFSWHRRCWWVILLLSESKKLLVIFFGGFITVSPCHVVTF